MLILTIRTDNPKAELAVYQNSIKLAEIKWQAHRQLSETIHTKIKELLASQNKDWHDIESIVCFEGPGSFTGLRIGLTVANTMADSLKIPIIASGGKNWAERGLKRILAGENDTIALPEYGRPARITAPKK